MTMSLNCSFVERMVGFDCPSMRHKFEKFSQDCIAVRSIACVKSGAWGLGRGNACKNPIVFCVPPTRKLKLTAESEILPWDIFQKCVNYVCCKLQIVSLREKQLQALYTFICGQICRLDLVNRGFSFKFGRSHPTGGNRLP